MINGLAVVVVPPLVPPSYASLPDTTEVTIETRDADGNLLTSTRSTADVVASDEEDQHDKLADGTIPSPPPGGAEETTRALRPSARRPVTDTDAFDGFYRSNYRRVVLSLRLATGSVEDAEDLAQEAFVWTLVHWARFEEVEPPRLRVPGGLPAPATQTLPAQTPARRGHRRCPSPVDRTNRGAERLLERWSHGSRRPRPTAASLPEGGRAVPLYRDDRARGRSRPQYQRVHDPDARPTCPRSLPRNPRPDNDAHNDVATFGTHPAWPAWTQSDLPIGRVGYHAGYLSDGALSRTESNAASRAEENNPRFEQPGARNDPASIQICLISRTLRTRGTRQDASRDHLHQNVRPSCHGAEHQRRICIAPFAHPRRETTAW